MAVSLLTGRLPDMKHKFTIQTVWFAILAIGFAGCSSKPDPNSELEKAAKTLQQADAGQLTPTPAQPAQPAPTTAASQQSPGQQMNQAMSLYKSGDYENAVVRLQTLRERTTLSPQQNMAVQDAMAAVMTDIYTRASKGDARAQQAVKQYEQSKTVRTK